jgi:hypothetical protein
MVVGEAPLHRLRPSRGADMTVPQDPAAQRRYRSLSSFYLADPRRVDSREEDVGLWWRDGADGPLHRAAWVADTGELYLVRLGPAEAGGGRVEVLGVGGHAELEQALEGWREACGTPDSLSWLREHAARLSRRVRDAQVRLAAAAAAVVACASAVAVAGELA